MFKNQLTLLMQSKLYQFTPRNADAVE